MRVKWNDLRLPEHRTESPFFIGSVEAIGVDLRAYIPGRDMTIAKGDRVAVPTGFAIAVPVGYYGRVAPRSGLALKNGIDVLAGVVDSDYRGELKIILINHGAEPFVIHNGDRIAQLVMEEAECWTPVEAYGLSDTARGEKGYGSSGVK
jgi:dUTP pyrophosphatase